MENSDWDSVRKGTTLSRLALVGDGWGWWERLARRGSSLRKWPRESRQVAGYRLAGKLAPTFSWYSRLRFDESRWSLAVRRSCPDKNRCL